MSNKDTIKSLDERQKARSKVSVWFGSKDNYYHPLKEALANACDEITNNFEKGIIKVGLSDDCKEIYVRDSGRGIPLKGKTDGKSNYELLLLTLFAGTNYDNNLNGKITTGCNGVGLTVTNYCSKIFEIESHRQKEDSCKITFTNGALENTGLVKIPNEENGTKVKFILDNNVFTNNVYDPNEIEDILKRTSGVVNNVKIIFEHKNEIKEFKHDNLRDYFETITNNNTCKLTESAKISYTNMVTTDEGVEVEETDYVELLMATSSEPTQESYLNITYLSEGGTINEGIINGARLFVNKHCKEAKLLDKKLGNITNEDIASSVSFLCNFLSTNVEFENQTKKSTTKKLYRQIAQTHTQSTLEIFKTEQPKDFERFVKHILQVQKFNSKAKASKEALKKKLNEKVDNLDNRINGLVDCKHHGAESELFICEGKSALGSVVLARDPEVQAAIAIRGKILNCLKADLTDILKNEIVLDLIKAMGCGIKADKKHKDLDSFDITKLRYGKIILAADADADGQNIVCLLLTMIYVVAPDLIEEGYVWIANTPLYEIVVGNDEDLLYIFTESEKEEKLKTLEGKKYKIARCKGLGELQAETMALTAMDPETRNLTKIDFNNAKAMIESFEVFMGTDVKDRKEYIENNLNKYLNNID